MILTDMHSHTSFSGDSSTPMNKMIETAEKIGLTHLAITEHLDIDFPPCDIDFSLDIPNYIKTIQRFKEEFSENLKLLIGIEFGMQPHLSNNLTNIASSYPFDVIICSTHLAGGIDPYEPEFFKGITRNQGYKLYFETVLENILATNDFDILGHLDYVIRYWRGEGSAHYNYSDFSDVLDAILKTVIKKDKSLEVNTAGYLAHLNQPNPTFNVLTRYYELGGELLTIGSDAHKPNNIATHFSQVETHLKSIGFKSHTIYINRKPIQLGF